MRIIKAFGLALLLTGVFAWGVTAQRASTLSPLQPFLVDIQQTVPVTFTFTHDDQTVNVPAAVDVGLTIQVSSDGTVSPTLQVGESAAPSVEVAALEPTPQTMPIDQNVDAGGRTYTTDIADGFTLVQVNSPDRFDIFSVAGIIRNDTNRDFGQYDLDISVSTFNAAGKLIAVNPGLLEVSNLSAGGTGTFTSLSMTSSNEVASYTIQITLD